jgi:hypothetical protein
MKRIPLTQNQFAIVDDEDFKNLAKYKWSASWQKHTKSYHAMRHNRGQPQRIRMHRQIMRLQYGDKRVS